MCGWEGGWYNSIINTVNHRVMLSWVETGDLVNLSFSNILTPERSSNPLHKSLKRFKFTPQSTVSQCSVNLENLETHMEELEDIIFQLYNMICTWYRYRPCKIKILLSFGLLSYILYIYIHMSNYNISHILYLDPKYQQLIKMLTGT